MNFLSELSLGNVGCSMEILWSFKCMTTVSFPLFYLGCSLKIDNSFYLKFLWKELLCHCSNYRLSQEYFLFTKQNIQMFLVSSAPFHCPFKSTISGAVYSFLINYLKNTCEVVKVYQSNRLETISCMVNQIRFQSSFSRKLSKTYTKGDLKISLYVRVHSKTIPWKFCFLNPKNSRVYYPWSLYLS